MDMKDVSLKKCFDSAAFRAQFHTDEPLGVFCGNGGTVTSETTPPTCTEYGVSVAVAAFTNPRFKSQLLKEAIEPTGHAYGDPIYEWSEDLSTCTAKVVCAYDEKHVISETAQSKYAVTKKPTCTDQGEGTYTVGFNNKRFYGQTKTVVIDTLGHDYVDHEAQAPTCSAVELPRTRMPPGAVRRNSSSQLKTSIIAGTY